MKKTILVAAILTAALVPAPASAAPLIPPTIAFQIQQTICIAIQSAATADALTPGRPNARPGQRVGVALLARFYSAYCP